VTLTVPFALYLLADAMGVFGVLAVLVAGLFLRSTANREVTSAGWLLGRFVWSYVEFAVSGLLFGLAEREAVLKARRGGKVSPAAADDVLFDVEARALRYES
jgi:hypothetical protein